MQPRKTQLEGAAFLARRSRAGLFDDPRVGKTGAACIALDCVEPRRALVVTTRSGVPVWRKAFRDWPVAPCEAGVIDDRDPGTARCIVSWGRVARPQTRAMLLAGGFDAVLLDESHYAKSFEAARTRAVYGDLVGGGVRLDTSTAVVSTQAHVWCLTGTPQPNSNFDLYPMLRALDPERLGLSWGPTDVRAEQVYLTRYNRVGYKKLSRWKKVPVIVGGLNLPELAARLDGFYLRRTQADVGITQPIYETVPVEAGTADLREVLQAQALVKIETIIRAARDGDTKKLDMELGPLRRLTGLAKVGGVAQIVEDEIDALGKVVIAFWHTQVGDMLERLLARHGVARVDGSTRDREAPVKRFASDPDCKVFLGQIQAAGEAIDLSVAADLIFAESSNIPKDMKQMALRITNHTQTRQPRVRVAALCGSVDEQLQDTLLRKWSAIREVQET